jgi:CRP-like cAMP-binding protein
MTLPLTFRQHESILHQGDQGEMLYLIQSGRVRIYVLGEEGQEISMRLMGPGEVFGELATMVGAARESTNKALGAFRRQGLIRLQRGQIIVVNPQALQEYVN